MTRRSDRVGDALRAEISSLILREVQDPRVHLASVCAVDVSPDLKRATILVSALGADTERSETIAALRSARKFIRNRLAKRMRHMKFIPELDFELDRGAEHSQHISDLLEGLNDEN